MSTGAIGHLRYLQKEDRFVEFLNERFPEGLFLPDTLSRSEKKELLDRMLGQVVREYRPRLWKYKVDFQQYEDLNINGFQKRSHKVKERLTGLDELELQIIERFEVLSDLVIESSPRVEAPWYAPMSAWPDSIYILVAELSNYVNPLVYGSWADIVVVYIDSPDESVVAPGFFTAAQAGKLNKRTIADINDRISVLEEQKERAESANLQRLVVEVSKSIEEFGQDLSEVMSRLASLEMTLDATGYVDEYVDDDEDDIDEILREM